MISRYTLPEMGAIWTEATRFRLFAEVEVAVVRARARRGLVPLADLAAIEEAPTPSPARVWQLDEELHHDVVAFLTAYGEGIGPAARHIHYGMTSSDLLDTTLALQLVRACDLLARRLDRLVATIRDRALEHRYTLCLGRTHGVAAEPTTFGLKLASHAFAFDRDRRRLRAARRSVAVGTISGAVGTYANLPAEVEAERLTGLGRLLRGYAVAALEDVALWHERDISHSSVERVALPDACCVLDYALERAHWLVAGLRVFPERMRANLQASGGLAGSSAALLALVDAGWSREDAYAAVQRAAMDAWEGKGGFRDLLLAEPGVAEVLGERALDAALDPARFVAAAGPILERLEAME